MKWHTSCRRVCHWCFYHILTSSVIYFWKDPWQHGIICFVDHGKLWSICFFCNNIYFLRKTKNKITGTAWHKNEKSEDYSKADLKPRVLFFITIFRLAIPAFFRFTDDMSCHFHRLFNNYSWLLTQSPFGLEWGRRPNRLLAQRPWGREE